MLLDSSLINLIKFREDFPFLFNRLGLTGMGVEIGVQRGDFSKHLLQYWTGKKLYMVDSWRHLKGYLDMANGDHNIQLDNMAKAFMSVYEADSRATMIREYSVEAANLFADHSLDFVFLDGDHSYVAVKADIEAWSPKIRPEGILCGHDYTTDKFDPNGPYGIMFPPQPNSTNSVAEFGVKKAVDEWEKESGIKVYIALPDDGNPTLPSWFAQL